MPRGRARARAKAQKTARLCVKQSARRKRLLGTLLSPAVQLPAEQELGSEEARLTDDQVASIFREHVPNVDDLLFRDQPGNYALGLIMKAYRGGLPHFARSPLHDRIVSSLRLVVHRGRDHGAAVGPQLQELAEAFTDCQFVQARVIERVALQLRCLEDADLRAALVRIAGEYKSLMVQALALEHVQGMAVPDEVKRNPTHYESRLTEDLGQCLGLNMQDVRRAAADREAARWFPRLSNEQCQLAVARCSNLFDLDALLHAVEAQFSGSPEVGTEQHLVVTWAASRLREDAKHVIFDDTMAKVDLHSGGALAMAILEDVFLGSAHPYPTDAHNGFPLVDLFN